MNDKEKLERQLVVEEAKTWLKTPYHHMGRIKGSGVDCGQILIAVWDNCGLIELLEVGHYYQDWSLHRSEEKYLEWILKYTKKVDRAPLPGDIILYKFGRCISHAAIVIDYPLVIHSYVNLGVTYSDSKQDAILLDKKGNSRECGVYSFW
jgi:cell wall-associated NlpC family hydrolase